MQKSNYLLFYLNFYFSIKIELLNFEFLYFKFL